MTELDPVTAVSAPSLTPAQLAHRIGDLLLEKKAQDLLVLDIERCSDIADYLIVATGGSKRQVQSLAEELRRELKQLGHVPLGMSGVEVGTWVLVDYGDVLVNLMQDEARRYFDLEALWADAPSVRRG